MAKIAQGVRILNNNKQVHSCSCPATWFDDDVCVECQVTNFCAKENIPFTCAQGICGPITKDIFMTGANDVQVKQISALCNACRGVLHTFSEKIR